jgi:predicted metal-dependent hydrolase
MSDFGEREIRLGLEKGIREFNESDFFQAHDTLEDVWMDVRGQERLFFQGLIQVSVGFYHLTCGNFAGAEHLLTRGVRKLEEFLPAHRGLDVGDLVARSSAILLQVVAAREGHGEAPDLGTIPGIHSANDLKAGSQVADQGGLTG